MENIKTKEDARQYAIVWQSELSERNISQGDLCDEQDFLFKLAEKFDLIEEFESNGII